MQTPFHQIRLVGRQLPSFFSDLSHPTFYGSSSEESGPPCTRSKCACARPSRRRSTKKTGYGLDYSQTTRNGNQYSLNTRRFLSPPPRFTTYLILGPRPSCSAAFYHPPPPTPVTHPCRFLPLVFLSGGIIGCQSSFRA